MEEKFEIITAEGVISLQYGNKFKEICREKKRIEALEKEMKEAIIKAMKEHGIYKIKANGIEYSLKYDSTHLKLIKYKDRPILVYAGSNLSKCMSELEIAIKEA